MSTAYATQDAIEERRWNEHFAQVAEDEEVSELAEFYDREVKDHHLIELFVNATHADRKAIQAAFDDCNFQEAVGVFMSTAAEAIARKQVALNRRG